LRFFACRPEQQLECRTGCAVNSSEKARTFKIVAGGETDDCAVVAQIVRNLVVVSCGRANLLGFSRKLLARSLPVMSLIGTNGA
jgi:hypothetical protein